MSDSYSIYEWQVTTGTTGTNTTQEAWITYLKRQYPQWFENSPYNKGAEPLLPYDPEGV